MCPFKAHNFLDNTKRLWGLFLKLLHASIPRQNMENPMSSSVHYVSSSQMSRCIIDTWVLPNWEPGTIYKALITGLQFTKCEVLLSATV